jgi:hypothetical protein
VAEKKYFATAPAQSQCALLGAHSTGSWRCRILPFGIHECTPLYFLLPVPNFNTELLTSPPPLASFPPRAPPPPAPPPPGCFYARDFAHSGGQVR